MDEFKEFIDINSDECIEAVWQKGAAVKGFNEDLFRKDAAGAWIARYAYGKTDDDMGWQIDHVFPKSLGGGDHLVNLRPMNHRNNLSKSDSYPSYIVVAKADGGRNADVFETFTVNNDLRLKLKSLYGIDDKIS